MGRLLFLLVAAATLAFFSGQSSGADRSLRSDRESADRATEVQAREVALSGHGAVRLAAIADAEADGVYDGPAIVRGNYGEGTFESEVSTTDTTLTIVTRAVHSGSEHTVWATYRAGASGVTIPPAFMRGGLVAGGNLPIEQPLTLRATDPASPASLLAGGNLEFRDGSNPSLIEGFGIASGNLKFDDGQAEADVFQPLANPDALPLSQASQPKLDLPDFKAIDFAHLATRTLPGGNYSGPIALGTAAAPEILYIDANFTTSGPVTFTGHGVVLVHGNFIINHDLRSDGANPVGLYSTGNFELRSGSLTVDGNILSSGNLKLMDDTVINGSVTALNNLELTGRAAINYIPASSNITEPFWPGESTTTSTGGASGTYQLVRYSEG